MFSHTRHTSTRPSKVFSPIAPCHKKHWFCSSSFCWMFVRKHLLRSSSIKTKLAWMGQVPRRSRAHDGAGPTTEQGPRRGRAHPPPPGRGAGLIETRLLSRLSPDTKHQTHLTPGRGRAGHGWRDRQGAERVRQIQVLGGGGGPLGWTAQRGFEDPGGDSGFSV